MRTACLVLTASSVLVFGCGSQGGAPSPEKGTDAGPLADAHGNPGHDGASEQDTGAAANDASSADDGGDADVLFEETASIGDMTLDPTSLYWVAGGARIMRLPLAGGTPVTLVSTPQISGASIGNIVVDASNLYWDEAQPSSGSPGGIFAIAVGGGGAPMKVADVSTPGSLSLDGEFLFVNTMPNPGNGDGEIDRVATSDGAVTPMARGVDGQSVIVAANGYVYLVVDQGNLLQNVFRISDDASAGPADAAVDASSDAGPLEPVSANTRQSTLVLSRHADSDEVYWAVFDEVYRYPGDGGAQADLGAVSDPFNPNYGGSIDALYPFNGTVFWYSAGFTSPGDLWEFPVGGNPREHLASTSGGPFVANDTSSTSRTA